MKFVLDVYHRNVPDESLIKDVQRVSQLLNKTTITIAEYDKYGDYEHSTIYRRFGSWKKALELAGLSTESHNFYITDSDYILDLQRVAFNLGKSTITITEYESNGKYNANKLSKRFGSWDVALRTASLESTGYHPKVTELDLFQDIENAWISLGRQPKTCDMKGGTSKYGMTTYCRHFGSWRKALEAFVEYINEEDDCDDFNSNAIEYIEEQNGSDTFPIVHKTKRDINLRMRFLVLKRDNFKCCACGASPAKNPSVELQIDHIIPWSKGGETTIENLQTLCAKCNLGKSDLM